MSSFWIWMCWDFNCANEDRSPFPSAVGKKRIAALASRREYASAYPCTTSRMTDSSETGAGVDAGFDAGVDAGVDGGAMAAAGGAGVGAGVGTGNAPAAVGGGLTGTDEPVGAGLGGDVVAT